jgi:hypothetical protein
MFTNERKKLPGCNKHQIPSTKSQTSINEKANDQNEFGLSWSFGHCPFEFVWSLVLGPWILGARKSRYSAGP